MSDLDLVSPPKERRAIQRDWLGHTVQLLGIAVVIGLPLMFWGISLNTNVSVLSERTTRNSQDIADMRQMQSVVTAQAIETGNKISRISTQLEDIIHQNKAK